ncbi:MAG: glutamate ABC transporter substrate-binding protein [Solirubrobacterales bacterium]|nr:glutamate ABC transporter substrate-binding protein [Solirubrobacterales bacterium]
MQQIRWRWLTALALALSVLALGACGDEDEGSSGGDTATTAPAKSFAAGSTMKALQDKGEITIGVKFDAPPFGRKDPQSGDVEGFDIDLAKAIADELGATPKYIEALSDNRIPFLKDGTADLILSTMTINAERDEEIDFSEPYFVAKGRILVKKDDTSITGVKDLTGKKVCTVLGSTYEETLKKQAPKAKRTLVDSYSECLELIQNGGVDAVSTDDVILTGMIIQDDTLKLVGEDLTTEPYGVGIKQGDTAFKEFVDGVIAAYKEDGRWATAYQKWVGQYTGEKQDPPTMTLQEAIDLTK